MDAPSSRPQGPLGRSPGNTAQPTHGLTLQQAAQALGLGEAALRKQLQRGYRRGYKVDGQWRLDLDPDVDGGRATDVQTPSTSGPAPDPSGPPLSTSAPAPEVERELVATLRTELAHVWAALEREQTASAELRRLLQQRLGAPALLVAAAPPEPPTHPGRLRRLRSWLSRVVT